MFLGQIQKKNPRLMEAALQLHRSGVIPPSCFVIDLDAVAANTRMLVQSAAQNGLSLYFITKQVGFNPLFAREAVKNGIEKAVAVDWNEAFTLMENGVELGHIGHLVQIPDKYLGPLLRAKPEVITVFSVEKARRLSEVAQAEGLQANVLLRVVDRKDYIYSGQEGGIALSDLERALDEIHSLPNITIAGVTAFPCTVFDSLKKAFVITNNLHTLCKAADLLAKRYSLEGLQLNVPGNSCCATFPLIREYGATHAEPGNALTGTTPLHALCDQPEIPALIHVSEISHKSKDMAYCYGGGLYRRSSVDKALVGNDPASLKEAKVFAPDNTAIDYYVGLKPAAKGDFHVGDSVLWSSRAQIFVTRSSVAIVSGIQSGKPALDGIFNPFGQKVAY